MAVEDMVLSGVLTVSLLVLIAKVLAGLYSRIGIPPILGELSAGVFFGPYALGQFVVVFGRPLIVLNDIVLAFSEIGAILILFSAGLQMTFAEFRGVGAKSFIIGGLGVALPFLLGFYTMTFLGQTVEAGLIVGAALSATSIAITTRVLESLGMAGTQEAKLTINAAVVDDVLGLAVLAVVISIIQAGQVPPALDIIGRLVVIVGVWLTLLLGLVFAVPRFFRLIPSWSVAGTEEALSTAVCFGSASLAAVLGLSPIVGAYAAGMGMAGSKALTTVKGYMEKVNFLFAPIFFAVVGASLNFSQLTWSALGLMVILVAVAALSKLVGCGFPAGMLTRDARVGFNVGVAMISRGEVGLVIAGLALTSAVIDQNVYAAIVGVVVVTTAISPLVLKYSNSAFSNGRGAG
jgi:Kef-type K+ transport system membrane component KefB